MRKDTIKLPFHQRQDLMTINEFVTHVLTQRKKYQDSEDNWKECVIHFMKPATPETLDVRDLKGSTIRVIHVADVKPCNPEEEEAKKEEEEEETNDQKPPAQRQETDDQQPVDNQR